MHINQEKFKNISIGTSVKNDSLPKQTTGKGDFLAGTSAHKHLTQNGSFVSLRNQESKDIKYKLPVATNSFSGLSVMVDDFENDFNSESDCLSFTGEDILKRLDIISNIDDEEDNEFDENEYDEEDDCDDLKSCIPLGDETVDLLIKDNLQVDSLDLLTPEMESFTFDIGKAIKTNNEKKELTESLNKIGLLHHTNKRCINTDPSVHKSDKKIMLNPKSAFEKVNETEMLFDNTIPVQLKSNNPIQFELSLSNKSRADINVGPIEEKNFEYIIKHNLIENLPIEEILSHNISSEDCEHVNSDTVHSESNSLQSSCNEVENSDINLLTDDQLCFHNSPANTTENSIFFEVCNSAHSDAQMPIIDSKSIELNEKVLASDCSEAESLMTPTSKDIPCEFSSDFICNNTAINLEKSEKSNGSQTYPAIYSGKVSINEPPTTECDPKQSSNVSVFSEDSDSQSSATVTLSQQNENNITPILIHAPSVQKKHPENTDHSLFHNSSSNIKLKTVKNNMILNVINSFPNTTKNITTLQQQPTVEDSLFKHPSIINVPSKYSIKKDKEPEKPYSNKYNQLQQKFPKIQSFSVKPREPPNMDYYKKMKGDNTIVSVKHLNKIFYQIKNV